MTTSLEDRAMVSEDELLRYLHAASVLLASAALRTPQRLRLLRRAKHWVRAVAGGVDQLVREAEDHR